MDPGVNKHLPTSILVETGYLPALNAKMSRLLFKIISFSFSLCFFIYHCKTSWEKIFGVAATHKGIRISGAARIKSSSAGKHSY